MELEFRKKQEKKAFMERFGGIRAEVGWDGALSYSATLDGGSSMDDLLSDPLAEEGMGAIGLMLGGASAGQHKLVRLRALRAALSKPPDVVANARKAMQNVNGLWEERFQAFIDYMESLPRTGPITVIMDEPDRSISITGQEGLWKSYLPKLAKDYQVIIATHSPFALFAPENNVIGMNEVHTAQTRDALEHLTDPNYLTDLAKYKV